MNDLMEDGFEIKISKKPINYSTAFIKEVLYNENKYKFYILNEVGQTDMMRIHQLN